jgi:hypothetical protein
MCWVPGYAACLSCTAAAVMVVSYLNRNEIMSKLSVWSACSVCESDIVRPPRFWYQHHVYEIAIESIMLCYLSQAPTSVPLLSISIYFYETGSHPYESLRLVLLQGSTPLFRYYFQVE